ncbi:hypothetical protein [Micromonospora chokoriensis]|uniref:hypothetical protein n=1 Tax=Micromonospora chokoriensis TaxID=356851 RepID=UPI0004C3D512|nr:hypothetical protein [Micromonospora chokoriensis]
MKPDRACPDYPNECVHPWAHARTYEEVKAAEARYEIDDTVNINFRGAVVTAVSARGAIQVQSAGCSFWVHPDDSDTEITRC